MPDPPRIPVGVRARLGQNPAREARLLQQSEPKNRLWTYLRCFGGASFVPANRERRANLGISEKGAWRGRDPCGLEGGGRRRMSVQWVQGLGGVCPQPIAYPFSPASTGKAGGRFDPGPDFAGHFPPHECLQSNGMPCGGVPGGEPTGVHAAVSPGNPAILT